MSQLSKLWEQYSNTGVYKELPFALRSRVRISNQIAIVTSFLAFFFFIYDFFFLTDEYALTHRVWFYVLHIGAIFFFTFVLFLNRSGWYVTAHFFMILIASSFTTINSIALAQPFRTELFFFAIAAFVFVIFNDLKVILLFFLVQTIAYILSARNIMEHHPGIVDTDGEWIIHILISFTVLFFIMFFMRRETNRYQEVIEIKNSQLSSDRNEMEKLNFTKDKIFSIISHDLRSPIASLQALLILLQNDHMAIDEFKKATSGLEKQVQQLSSSLDELLTWSRAQLHGINPEPTIIKLKPLISEIIAVNKIVARNKKIIITTSVPADMEAYCDLNMLKSIITNLTTNAIKFTPVGGAVSIFTKRDNNQICIYVEDTGVGIPAENMSKILSTTIHFTTRGTNNEKGTGLGLVMCNEFVSKNNGSLHIKSEDGKGSLFSIKLPIGIPVKA